MTRDEDGGWTRTRTNTSEIETIDDIGMSRAFLCSIRIGRLAVLAGLLKGDSGLSD